MHKNSSAKTPKKTVSIVGARGYSGLELARLLLAHPEVELTHAFATRTFDLSNDLFASRARQVRCLTEDQLLTHLTDIVFLATPAEVSLNLAPQILAAGKKVIDLSGAYRLHKSDTEKWYGFKPGAPEVMAQSQYGFVPYCGALPAHVKLISNPGCYATAITLALIPLLRDGLIETEGLVIDAKSGTTGAGRKASEAQLFAEVDGECRPYRVGQHQHTPEIIETVQTFAGCEIDPHFVTHLLPVKRGILASMFAKSKTKNINDISAAFDKAYADYPLVRHGSDVAKLSKLSNVVGTPYAHISYTLIENKLYLFSTVDNLLKGAASQAVENLNRFLDLPLGYALAGEN